MTDSTLLAGVFSGLDTPIAVAHWPSGEVIFANDTFGRISGLDALEAANIRDYLGTVAWDEAVPAIEANGSYEAEVELLANKRDYFYRFSFRLAESRQILIVEGTDIGKLRELEYMLDSYSALAERSAHDLRLKGEQTARIFEEFTRNAPVGMYVKDGSGRYIMVNPRIEALFERDKSEILGKTVRDMLPPEEAEMVEAFDRQILETRRTTAVEERLESSDHFEWTLVVRFPIQSMADPDMIGGFDIDITAQKHAEMELALSRERLNQAERMTALGSLLAGISHELNNPLAIVVGEAALLEEDARGTDLAESAERIRNAAERCARIVQSFLAIARQKPPTREQTDMNALIRSVVELTTYQMK